MKYDLMEGDCLQLMRELPDASVDMILCDLPYGTTQNKWDSIIPFEPLWKEYWRICTGAVVLTAAQPFTSALVMSQINRFKYDWVWKKSKVTGVLNAKRQPLRCHESVLVFAKDSPPYAAQGVVAISKRAGTGFSKNGSSGNYGAITQTEDGTYEQTQTNWPRSVLEIASEGKTTHPTQKPVALMEYLIRTYTDEGMVVLDNCMGSGTTGVACANTGRRFIGMEMNADYFDIACARVENAYAHALA
jgi:site-specific DNA-methyltransferase (adenine-specific)